MLKRCEKGTRRNKKTGLCEPNPQPKHKTPLQNITNTSAKLAKLAKHKTTKYTKKRCEKGTRRNKKTGLCEPLKKQETLKNKITKYDSSAKQSIKNIEIIDEKRKSKEKQKQILQRFFLKNKSKIRLNYLKHICSSAGDCLSFGKETEKINKLFHNFVDFSYVEFPIKRIGTVSVNGFVSMLKYKRNDYECYAILKSSQKLSSDNLYYEYLVGRDFINHMKNYFPCFVETYGIFTFKFNIEWRNFRDENFPFDKESLKAYLTDISDYPEKEIIKLSCNNSANMISILCQHINVKYSLEQLLQKYEILPSEKFLIPNCLYQILLPLYYLRNVYSHNDLHTENVLCFPATTKNGNLGYINLNYIINGLTYTLRSEYILKIIDYGRSYYYYDSKKNTDESFKKIFKEKSTVCDQYKLWYYLRYYLDHEGDYKRYQKMVTNINAGNEETNFIKFIKNKNTTGFFNNYYKNRECIGEINIYTDQSKPMETIIYP
jgi:hypothetical protein